MSAMPTDASASAKRKPPPAKARKGPRPRHVPQRTCIACRTTDAKRTLIRLVRTPEGLIEVDPTGKRSGRGAYLCARMGCWQRGINEKLLIRALRIENLTAENRAALLRYADERVPEDEPEEHVEVTTGTNDH